MRFEVPQFIEVEDKIFGPLTWRQFLYVGGGIGMGVVLFLTTPMYVYVPLGVPLGALAFALAFYPVNTRPFSYFLEAMYHFFSGHRLYLWRRKEQVVYKARPSEAPAAAQLTTTSTRPKRTSITALARNLEMQAIQKKDS